MHPLIPVPPGQPTTLDLRERAQAATFTTPRPVYEPPAPPVRLAEQTMRMDHHEKARLRAAAFRATRVYPGPIGELLSRELVT